MDYLLDSSVCIPLMRKDLLITDKPIPANSYLSSIVVGELWVAAFKYHNTALRRAEIEELIIEFPVLAYTAAAAEHYGDIRARLEKKGLRIGAMDLLIAAHARSLGATLLTGNLREFQRVPGLLVAAW
ncbi:VapC toxin family PIN domain ribonuclease [Verrucomicrobia bacterium LW23]|nr:VapC toxin family PIN domain ribonuclease [Verrucomicrobia bacterium LW23]